MIYLFMAIVFLCASVVYLIKGPSVWDRLLGMKLISAKVVSLIIIFASENETAYLLDLAIVYALFGFICTIFIATFIAERKKVDAPNDNGENNSDSQ